MLFSAWFSSVKYIFTFISNSDSLDWKDYDATTIIRRVTEHKALQNGAIILCHNGGKHTAEALDELLTTLKQKGFELVPISQLILKDSYAIDPNGQQYQK